MDMRVFLRGGLGNQFFQWMHARRLALAGHEVVLDTSFLRARAGNQAAGRLELEEVFSDLRHRVVHIPQLWRVERIVSRLARWGGLMQGDEPCARQASATLHYGYFQVALDLQGALVQQARVALQPALLANDIPLDRYAAIHLRLGDYQQSQYNRTQLGLLGLDYYRAACARLHTSAPLPWLVVSDDYTAARRLCRALALPGQPQIHFLDEQLGGHDTPRRALQALLQARTLVCANSSFSAMAGYLGRATTVYAPRPWFRGAGLSHQDPAAAAWTRIDASFRNA
jgi:hypothetical protein